MLYKIRDFSLPKQKFYSVLFSRFSLSYFKSNYIVYPNIWNAVLEISHFYAASFSMEYRFLKQEQFYRYLA